MIFRPMFRLHKKSFFEKDHAGAILEIAVKAHIYPNLAPWYIFFLPSVSVYANKQLIKY